MSLPDVGRALRERWVVVVATILLALAAGSALYALRPPTYTATLTVYAAPRPTDPATTTPEAAYQGSLLAKERIPSYLQLVTSPQVVSQVIARTRLDESVSGLTSRVTATSAPDSVLVDIAVQAPSAQQAVGIAEAMAQVLPPAVDQLEQSGAPGPPNSAPVSLRVIRPIPVPDRPSTPGLALTLGLALLAGVVLGVAIALVREALDRSLRTLEALGAAAGLPVLGSLPVREGRRADAGPAPERSALGEAYRKLGTALQHAATPGTRHGAPGVLAVTSPNPGEGRTSVVVNLATAAAGAGVAVLVVDADLRRPRAARTLGVTAGSGLTDVLAGQARAESVIRTSPDGIDVLAPGPLPSNPAELLAGGALPDLFEELRGRYTLVLVDVPPLLPVADAAVVAAATDGSVVLARRGATSRADLAAAVQTLETAGPRPVGTVLVADPDHRPPLPETGDARATIMPRRPMSPPTPDRAAERAADRAADRAFERAADRAPGLAPDPTLLGPPAAAPAPVRWGSGSDRAPGGAGESRTTATPPPAGHPRAGRPPAGPAQPPVGPAAVGPAAAGPAAAGPAAAGPSVAGPSSSLAPPLPEPRPATSGPTRRSARHRQPDGGGRGGSPVPGAAGDASAPHGSARPAPGSILGFASDPLTDRPRPAAPGRHGAVAPGRNGFRAAAPDRRA